MIDKCFIVEDPALEAVAVEYIVARARAKQACRSDGVGERFDRFTSRMGDAHARLARMLGVLPGIFFSPAGQVSLLRIERITLDDGRRRCMVALPSDATCIARGLAPLPARPDSVALRARRDAHEHD